ncbi:MAG TPA: aldo/keto reductase [Acidimicrobiales bacterium]|nr:aldo/keto reductase [Acidimicrobiales bacterium]
MNADLRIPLRDGRSIPALGLGVWQIPDGEQVQDAVHWALDAGIRHFDTAKYYKNERGVGEAIRTSGVAREEIWVTTKLFPLDALWVERAFHDSLQRLDIDYIDLYLVHFPLPGRLLQTWRAMEKIAKSGLAKSVGVSNYSIEHLERTLRDADVAPVLNQIEVSPYHFSKGVVAWCQTHDVVVEAYSPLTHGRKLDDPTLQAIARAHSRTPAQVLIRWSLQHDFVVIPKSCDKERIEANARVFDFCLTDEEMLTLDTLG